MTLLDEFVAAFGVWEEARRHLPLMFDEQEMRLVVALQAGPATVEGAAGRLGIDPQQARELLEGAYRRCLVDRSEEGGARTYSAGSFYAFLNHFAKFENWDEIPAADRRAIDRRFLAEFTARMRPRVLAPPGRGGEAADALPNDTVLLLSEVEEMIDAAKHIIVQPCDCRRLGQNCDRPVETCIWLDDSALEALDRGHGRRLTTEAAKELVRRADRQGLMHTADGQWRERGLHAICNCCACDCYPFRAARELGTKGLWPQSRYLAVYDEEVCNHCGACVRRCHFEAFYHDGPAVSVDGRPKESVRFDPDRCWGCGLCANTCPTGAITMEPWP